MMSMRRFLLLFACGTIAGCVTQNPQPAASASGPGGVCELSDSALREVQERALAFLLKEWPVLDTKCEQITEEVRYIHPDSCAIAGTPIRSADCPEPLHEGFSVIFSPDTLQPVQVFFKVR